MRNTQQSQVSSLANNGLSGPGPKNQVHVCPLQCMPSSLPLVCPLLVSALQLNKASAAADAVNESGGGANGSAGDDGESEGPNWCDLEQLLDSFEKQTGRRATYSICFY